VNTDLFSSTGQ